MAVIEVLNAVIPCGKASVREIHTGSVLSGTAIVILNGFTFGEGVTEKLGLLFRESKGKIQIGSHKISFAIGYIIHYPVQLNPSRKKVKIN